MKEWIDQINSELPISVDLIDKINAISENWDDESAKSLLSSIRYNTQSEILLFQIIKDLPNPEIWFQHLFSRYFLDNERIKNYGIPWYWMNYFKIISMKLFNQIDYDLSLGIWTNIKDFVE